MPTMYIGINELQFILSILFWKIMRAREGEKGANSAKFIVILETIFCLGYPTGQLSLLGAPFAGLAVSLQSRSGSVILCQSSDSTR